MINNIKQSRVLIVIMIALFAGFALLYMSIGFKFAETPAFNSTNRIFELDVPFVIDDMTFFAGDHYRTLVHPLYVLIVNPIGSSMFFIFDSKVKIAVFMNALFGSCAVVFAFVFFYIFGKDYVNAAMLALLYGVTMSQLVFGSIPETMSLATSSLLVTYLLFLIGITKRRLYFSLWIIAGVLSIGVTTTNVIQTMICFFVLSYMLSSKRKRMTDVLAKGVLLICLIFTITVFLAVIQKWLYPSSRLFFRFDLYDEEFRYVSFLALRDPLFVFLKVCKQFFLVNIVASFPVAYRLAGQTITSVRFGLPGHYSVLGLMSVIVWWGVLCYGISRSIVEKRAYASLFVGAFLCLLFNCFFHSFFGVITREKIELFLYSGNVTFLIFIFMSPYVLMKGTFIRVTLGLLVLLVGFNNLYVLRYLITLYRQ